MPGSSSRSTGARSGSTGGRVLSASRKVIGGKMVKVEVELVGRRVRRVTISGDFFAYPAEVIEEMEREMTGADVGELPSVVDRYRGRVELVGITLEDLRELLRQLAEASGA